MFLYGYLYGYDTSDMWVWVVSFECKVFVLETEDIVYIGVDEHVWQGSRFTGDLQSDLV